MSLYRVPESQGGTFAFEVGREGYGDRADKWAFQLPHMCDEWVISKDADKAKVIADAERFIAEAQVALTKLREMP